MFEYDDRICIATTRQAYHVDFTIKDPSQGVAQIQYIKRYRDTY